MARRISHVLEDALEIAKDQERIPYEAPLDAMLLLPVEKLIEKLGERFGQVSATDAAAAYASEGDEDE